MARAIGLLGQVDKFLLVKWMHSGLAAGSEEIQLEWALLVLDKECSVLDMTVSVLGIGDSVLDKADSGLVQYQGSGLAR